MLRIDGRVLAASVVGVFVVGAVLGVVAAGALGTQTPAGDADGTPTPDAATPSPAAAPTGTAVPTGSAVGTGTVVGSTTGTADASVPTSTGTGTGTMTGTPTVASTPTPPSTSTATASPSPTQTRTPMLIRRFDETEIERELRQLLNGWRAERDLPEFNQADGSLVADLNAMADDHSVAMADAGQTLHDVDGRTSADRYHEYEVYWNCWLKADDGDYFVTPDGDQLELLDRTYAGITYDGGDGVDYNGNESAVAADIFDTWTENAVYSERLSEYNATRIGIGIELTRDNEVYATGNLCGPPDRSG